MHFESHGESAGSMGTLPDENASGSVYSVEETPGGAGAAIGEVHYDRA